jgi:hypothetical protein
MEKHQHLSDFEFEIQFRDCTFDPHIFSHEAHLRLGWIHIKKYGLERACQNVCEQILAFDCTHDKGEKFHTTLTLASLKIMNHFMNRTQSETFQGLLEEFPRLKNAFKELIDAHYGFDVYNSEEAKKEYLAPDLLVFD